MDTRKSIGRLTVGKLAQAADVNLTTIRYYQRRGLLREPDRPWGGLRYYSESDLARLWLIRHAKELGFTLTEIVDVIARVDQQDCRAIRSMAEDKLREISRRIGLLNTARKALRQLVDGCRHETRQPGCPPTCPMVVKPAKPGKR